MFGKKSHIYVINGVSKLLVMISNNFTGYKVSNDLVEKLVEKR